MSNHEVSKKNNISQNERTRWASWPFSYGRGEQKARIPARLVVLDEEQQDKKQERRGEQ